jgi:hypothetical protein
VARPNKKSIPPHCDVTRGRGHVLFVPALAGCAITASAFAQQPPAGQTAAPVPTTATSEPTASSGPPLIWPDIYVDLGLETITPTAHPVHRVGNSWAVAFGGGYWGPILRLGAEFEVGQANDCAACTPFSSQWNILAGGLLAAIDILESRRWALSAGLGFQYMVAFAQLPDASTQSMFRPGAHIAVDLKSARGIGRLEMQFTAEDWIYGSQSSLALGARLGLLCCRRPQD